MNPDKFFKMSANDLMVYAASLEKSYNESADFHNKKLAEWVKAQPKSNEDEEVFMTKEEEEQEAGAQQAIADYRDAHPEECDEEDNDPRSMGWVNDRGLP